MKYSYYPGCSLERNAIAYHESTMEVAVRLGIEFSEIDDWTCCGATEYMSIELLASYSLIARNLALAADRPQNGQLVAPCSACFLNLSKADRHLAESKGLADQVNQALEAGGMAYEPGSVRVRHLLEVLTQDVGLEAIAAQITRPLYGLRVAPYYGCLIVRPAYQGSFDDPEYPTSLDQLLNSLGTSVVDYPLKTHCCGGHMTQISEGVALELIRRLLKNAADYEADMIVTLCPMCQLNLDAYQESVNKRFGTDYQLPVLFFTQLIGLAMDIPPERLGFGREFVPVKAALAKILEEPAKPPRKARAPKEALPLPRSSKEATYD